MIGAASGTDGTAERSDSAGYPSRAGWYAERMALRNDIDEQRLAHRPRTARTRGPRHHEWKAAIKSSVAGSVARGHVDRCGAAVVAWVWVGGGRRHRGRVRHL